MRVLVVNAGSSSLKLRLLDAGDGVVHEATHEGADDRAAWLRAALAELDGVDAVGHRIVHGGARHRQPVLADARVRDELRALVRFAPLHQPPALDALEAARERLPGVPHVCCFDTAFHATLPAAAATYAIPRAWRERWGIRRYGFHGLSHAWVARRVGGLAGDGARIVSCHLGAGASLCAIADGRSVDTTMGFTPLAGLAMATRCGDLDPGVVLWLLEHTELDAPALGDALQRASGLLALAGTPDMRAILRGAERGDLDAELALEVYVHRLRAGIAAMAASLGGIDALAFAGGVGENANEIRARAAASLGFLGVAVDPARNRAGGGEIAEIGACGAAVRTFVVQAREELEIARQVRALVGGAAG